MLKGGNAKTLKIQMLGGDVRIFKHYIKHTRCSPRSVQLEGDVRTLKHYLEITRCSPSYVHA